MPDRALADRLARVRDVVAEARRLGGWTHHPRIVAVTKTHGPEAVLGSVAVGLDAVGENKVQEALDKQAQCAGAPVEWHLIGGLQRNKARHAAGKFGLIHSIDRIDLATELDRRVPDGSRQRVLVQVNCSDEAQKGGVAPADLAALLDSMRSLGRLEVCGLMTMAAFGASESVQRQTFGLLRVLRDTMTREGHRLPELSMGMSDDYPAAVREGATLLRLGTVLFGQRNYGRYQAT